MASSTEVEQPLKLKKSSVVVLRVSIHCEGCKRKVKKLLQSLPGVDDIEIERLQQRVVVTGDVTPQTLITKLVKSGKNAQLWPQKPPQVVQESVMSGNSPPIPAPDPSKVNTTNIPSAGDTPGKASDKVDEPEKLQVEVKVEENKPETGNTPSPTTVVEKKEQQSENSGSRSGGGGVGDGGEGKKKKKKKKKGQSSNKSGNIGETSSQDIDSGPMPTSTHSNQTRPHHQGYQYALPRHNYTPPPAPVYTMSYNTAHPPVNSYTTSYYAPSPPPQSYAYSHFGSEMPPPPNVPQPTQSYGYTQFGYDMAPPPSVPTGYESYKQPSSGDSFEMFSDENPNGCSVM